MLLGGLYASDALTRGQVYDVPLDQAYGELASMPVPPALVQATTGTDGTEIEVRRSPQSIGWHFKVRGQEVAVFSARLSAEGPNKTRVIIDYSPGEPLSPELARLTSATLTRDLARIAMSEQVEAHLEHRPVDEREIADALAQHAAAHPEQVREFGLAVGGMMKDLRRQIDENSPEISGSAGDQAEPPGLNQSAMDAATQPSVVLPIN